MPRNLRTESEFGLPRLPDPFGNPIAEGATGIAAITGMTDADAIKAGGNDLSLHTVGHQLREIYATADDQFGTGPAAPELNPVVKK